MELERSGEYSVLDKSRWDEIPDKKVQASGYVYLGTKYKDTQVRVFVLKEEKK